MSEGWVVYEGVVPDGSVATVPTSGLMFPNESLARAAVARMVSAGKVASAWPIDPPGDVWVKGEDGGYHREDSP